MGKPDDGIEETLEATPGSGAEQRELNAGYSIDRYQIVSLLGAGGMGRVYKARDPDLNRELAIKVLRRAPDRAGSGLEQRLLREAQAMARLKHANLATVYDVGTVRGEVFIAFELIDGETMSQWMRQPGRTTAEKLDKLIAAGRGLAAAHSAGVIHRDFKPDNVLVARDGDVKVVDFGLARGVDGGDDKPGTTVPVASRDDALASDLTATGSLLGTPAYMAPEQHRGQASDARADQFGFAVSAWEALHGVRPFQGTTLEQLAKAICSGEIAPPPATSDVPSRIDEALRRALSVEPAARFSDMGELLDALAQPAPSVAAPTVAPAAASSASRRRLVAVVSGTVAVIAVGAVALVASSRDHDAKPESPASATRESRATDDYDKTAIRNTIRANVAGVTGCYEAAQNADPSFPPGTVEVKFVINKDGTVQRTEISRDSFNGAGGVARCVASKTFGWTFPPPGGVVDVTYPFKFSRPSQPPP